MNSSKINYQHLQMYLGQYGESPDLSEYKSIAILGANGAGKTRLGFGIEDSMRQGVLIIASQRSLNFNKIIPISNFEEIKKKLDMDTSNIQEGLRASMLYSKDTHISEKTREILPISSKHNYDILLEYILTEHFEKS